MRFSSRRGWPLTVLLSGCQGTVGADETAVTPVVTVSEEIPTVVNVRWETSTPGRGSVEYGLNGAFDFSTPEEREVTTAHERVLLGLKAGATYQLRPVTVDAAGRRTVGEESVVNLESPPEGLPLVTITDYDPERAARGGFILTSLLQTHGAWMVILDRDGDYVWFKEIPAGLSALGTKLHPETESFSYLLADPLGATDQGGIWHVSLDGERAEHTRAWLGHHDHTPLPDGRFAWLSYDFRPARIAEAEYLVAGELILGLEEGGTNEDPPDIGFALLDEVEPYIPCVHFDEEVYNTGAHDFSHGNSLIYDPDQDVFRLLAKNTDALYVIDRATGALLYTVGGIHPDFATEDPADMWSHGHMSQAWDGGFTLFDNGAHRAPQFSRVSEYALDEDAGTLELVWSWSGPEERYNPMLGDVRKLEHTYLTSWTTFGLLMEVTPEGEVVWRAEAEVGNAIGRVHWLKSLYELSEQETF